MLLDAGYALKTDSSSKQRAPGEISAGPLFQCPIETGVRSRGLSLWAVGCDIRG